MPWRLAGSPHPSLGARLPAASGAGPLPLGPLAWSDPPASEAARVGLPQKAATWRLWEGAGLGGGAAGPSLLPGAAPGLRRSGLRRALRGADGLEEGESLRPGFVAWRGLGFDGKPDRCPPPAFGKRKQLFLPSASRYPAQVFLSVFVAGVTSVQSLSRLSTVCVWTAA